jgi:hypothetical protein
LIVELDRIVAAILPPIRLKFSRFAPEQRCRSR